MRFFRKTCGEIFAVGLVFGLACVMSGCDSAGSQSTQYKPIESNILKKLGDAGQAQSEAAKGNITARVKKKR
jgi:hypothetical protein